MLNVRCIGITCAALLLGACAGSPYVASDPGRESIPAQASSASLGQPVAQLAMELIGTPYVYGGEDLTGFDCSGLVFYTYQRNGFDAPRTSLAQFRAARKISLADADAGDLVFFQDQEKLSHVGIYLGDGRFIHAPASGRTVSVAHLGSPYYQQHLVAVGRLLPN